MGNCCAVEGAIDHWIYVKTGDRKGAGTDANIKIILHDDKGQKSPEIALDCIWRNDFERGQTDTFQAPPLKQLGALTQLELWRDNAGVAPDWYCEVIMVNDARNDQCYYFPVQRWVLAEYRYIIPQFDTSLPNLDPFPEQRRIELERKRKLYNYAQHAADMPVQVHQLPDDEKFSDDYQWDLESRKAELLAKGMLTKLMTAGKWSGLEDLTNLYKFDHTFPEPRGLHNFGSDMYFGAQRLVGCNPLMIRLCTELPENLGVTEGMLQPFLEGWKVPQIIAAKRLFITDYKILENLPTKDDRMLCAPIALFFLNAAKELLPIAIQLHQDIHPDNPVFLCNDSPFTWKLAKMWLNHADSTVHQSLSHLGFTHILMEGVCIATHRQLASNHPIFKLLAPHFLFLLAINSRGIEYLISPGGWVDKTTTVGRDGMFELMRRGAEEWRIDVHGNLPRELEMRGVLDNRVLPWYPYRDDGLLVHKAIENYVTRIIKHYYGSCMLLAHNSKHKKTGRYCGVQPDPVYRGTVLPALRDSYHKDNPLLMGEDKELQSWAQELARDKEDGGVGLKGVPNNGEFKTNLELINTVTSIIFTCTCQHAAVNFGQYEEYGFPPNYPALLHGDPPSDRGYRQEEDVVAVIPDKDTTLNTMAVTQLLSMRATNSLSNWEFQYQYDPPALIAEKNLREELDKISATVKQRNEHRPPLYRYDYLDPENIPNAISI